MGKGEYSGGESDSDDYADASSDEEVDEVVSEESGETENESQDKSDQDSDSESENSQAAIKSDSEYENSSDSETRADEYAHIKKKLRKNSVPLKALNVNKINCSRKVNSYTAFLLHTKQPAFSKENCRPKLLIDAAGVLLDSANILKSNRATQVLFDKHRDMLSGVFMSGEIAVKGRPGVEEMLLNYRNWKVEIFIISKEVRAWAMHDAITKGMLFKHQEVKYVKEPEEMVDRFGPELHVVLTAPERSHLFHKLDCNIVTVPSYKFFPVDIDPSDENMKNCVLSNVQVKQALADALGKKKKEIVHVAPSSNKRISVFTNESHQKSFKEGVQKYNDFEMETEEAVSNVHAKYARPIRRMNIKNNLQVKIPQFIIDSEGETPQQRRDRHSCTEAEKFYARQSGLCYICRIPLSPVDGISYKCMSSMCPAKDSGVVVELPDFVESFVFTEEGAVDARTSLVTTPAPVEEWYRYREPVRKYLCQFRSIVEDVFVDTIARKVHENANEGETVLITIQRICAAFRNTSRVATPKLTPHTIKTNEKVRSATWALGNCFAKKPELKNALYDLANREGALQHPGFVEGAVYSITLGPKKPLSPDGRAFVQLFFPSSV